MTTEFGPIRLSSPTVTLPKIQAPLPISTRLPIAGKLEGRPLWGIPKVVF
jgi:hypothetical protein